MNARRILLPRQRRFVAFSDSVGGRDEIARPVKTIRPPKTRGAEKPGENS